MVGSQTKSGRVLDFGIGNSKGPTAVSVEPEARYCKQLTVLTNLLIPHIIKKLEAVHKNVEIYF